MVERIGRRCRGLRRGVFPPFFFFCLHYSFNVHKLTFTQLLRNGMQRTISTQEQPNIITITIILIFRYPYLLFFFSLFSLSLLFFSFFFMLSELPLCHSPQLHFSLISSSGPSYSSEEPIIQVDSNSPLIPTPRIMVASPYLTSPLPTAFSPTHLRHHGHHDHF